MELSKETIEEIYKDIRVSPKYMKHANKYQQYIKCGMYFEAAREAKLMKQIENEIFAEIAKSYIDSNAHAVGVINSMSEQDRHSMNVIANAMYMLSDVLNILVIDADLILRKYGLWKMKEYEDIQELLKETNKKIANFDTIMKDDKASMLFGECSDKLYKLIFNQANSYVNKLKKHEESVNKKAARHAEVA
jgi:hypothetical protein